MNADRNSIGKIRQNSGSKQMQEHTSFALILFYRWFKYLNRHLDILFVSDEYWLYLSYFLSLSLCYQVKQPARYWTKRSPSSSPGRKRSNLPSATPSRCPVRYLRQVSKCRGAWMVRVTGLSACDTRVATVGVIFSIDLFTESMIRCSDGCGSG